MVDVVFKDGRLEKFSLGPSAGKTFLWTIVVLVAAALLIAGKLQPHDIPAWFRVPW